MNIQSVQWALCRINNNSYRNIGGCCEQISVLAADALIGGQPPQDGSAFNFFYSPRGRAAELNKQTALSLPPDNPDRHIGDTRAYQVWMWLKGRPAGKVYVFAQDEDHCYNFVVDNGIFLIDASTQLYRRVNTPGDASFYRNIPNYPYRPGFKTGSQRAGFPASNTDFGFNYLSPQPKNADDNLVIYEWGDLHQNWR